jgi:hypothetical protein
MCLFQTSHTANDLELSENDRMKKELSDLKLSNELKRQIREELEEEKKLSSTSRGFFS